MVTTLIEQLKIYCFKFPEPRAPGQPRNLSLGKTTSNPDGLWTQEINWAPPASELPIKNYFVRKFLEKF